MHRFSTTCQERVMFLTAIESFKGALHLSSTKRHCTAALQGNMSAPSLAPYILKRPWLKRWMMPIANWYADAAGYRRLGTTSRQLLVQGVETLTMQTGLRADDLIPEENDTVQLALKRLPPKEAYDRVFRLRRAFQVRGRPFRRA